MIPSVAPKSKTADSVNPKAHEAYLLGSFEENVAGELKDRQGMGQTGRGI
jgi:hypothetical protein